MTQYLDLFGSRLEIDGAEAFAWPYLESGSNYWRSPDFQLRLVRQEPDKQIPNGAIRTFCQPGWPTRYAFRKERFYLTDNVCLALGEADAQITYLQADPYVEWLLAQVVRYFAKIMAVSSGYLYLPSFQVESDSKAFYLAGREGGGRERVLAFARQKGIRVHAGTTLVNPSSTARHWFPVGGPYSYKASREIEVSEADSHRSEPINKLIIVNRWEAEECSVQSLALEPTIGLLNELNEREFEYFTHPQLRKLQTQYSTWLPKIEVQHFRLGKSESSLSLVLQQLCGVPV